MPYKLRKAPKRELYWVVTTETGKKHSKDPIPLEKAKAQKRILESALTGGIQNPPSEAVMKAVELLRRGLDADLVRDSIVLYLDLENNENEHQVMALAQQYIQNNNVGVGGASCKAPYHDYTKGKASVFALTCIDPRYTFDVAYYLQHKKELHQDYDLFTLAGASLGATKKEWERAFFDNLELGLKLHDVKEVWCFDHLDCGMYKATFGLTKDDDPKIHKSCMDKLKAMVHKKHPQLKFREFLVDEKGHVKTMDKAMKGGMVPVGPPMGIIPAFGPPAGIIPAGGPRHRGPGVRGGPMGLWHPGIHLGPGTSTSAHPKAPPRTTTGTGKKCCCGKGKYSKVAIDVMEAQMNKKEDALFQWIKRQAKKGVSFERVAEEMTKGGVPHSVQFDLIRDALKELNAEKSA